MEVNCFQILLIDVTFYLKHVQKVVLNVLIKMKTRIYAAPAVKGLIRWKYNYIEYFITNRKAQSFLLYYRKY